MVLFRRFLLGSIAKQKKKKKTAGRLNEVNASYFLFKFKTNRSRTID